MHGKPCVAVFFHNPAYLKSYIIYTCEGDNGEQWPFYYADPDCEGQIVKLSDDAVQVWPLEDVKTPPPQEQIVHEAAPTIQHLFGQNIAKLTVEFN